jgi:hypothetical protein
MILSFAAREGNSENQIRPDFSAGWQSQGLAAKNEKID